MTYTLAVATELPSWVPGSIADAWGRIEGTPWLAALTIVVVAFVVGKLAEILLTRGVGRITRATATDLDDRIVGYLHRPVFLTVFLGGLVWAARALAVPPGALRVVAGTLWTLLVLVWFRATFLSCRLVLHSLSRSGDRFRLIEARTIPLLDMTAKLVLAGGASYAVLLIWDIDPTAWLASAGIIGIAVGFAAKDTLANLFSGFFILADAPYKIGDFIVLDTGERGRVVQIGMRSTRLLTRDDIEITLPNAVIGNAKIINESGGPHEKERIRVAVGVAYGSDADQVCEVLRAVAVAHEHVCREPEPRVRLRRFGESGLDFELLCWIDEPVLRGRMLHELNMAVYKRFAELGIEIPYPKRDVYLHRASGAPLDGPG